MLTVFPQPFPSQFSLRGESMTCYGSDFRGIIDYEFNDQGYRSPFNFELTEKDLLTVGFGSSIATGHGLELDQSFGSLVAQQFNTKFWNFGQGCYRSSNQTILEQIEFLVSTDLNIAHWVIQFTHINRQGNKFDSHIELDKTVAMANFITILNKITDLLKGKSWCWILCDYSDQPYPDEVVNHPNKIAIDPDSVDHISVAGYEELAPTTHALKMLSYHPGAGWHRSIADLMIEKLQ